ncbi:hypothetical protein EVAR_28750_1 [Eumeta japonica]|uniref:Uncharacterized protein n=1 Tax=Eumeta variegata TaxID=151549 RepID=A0A4C1YYV2_EUMVA|nr:hypothetical protein EVAR_28750_1 [Eumeta japonica]
MMSLVTGSLGHSDVGRQHSALRHQSYCDRRRQRTITFYRAKEIMCRSLGLRGTATVFSTAAAQAAASRAGYSTMATRFIGEVAKHRFILDHDLKVMGLEIL